MPSPVVPIIRRRPNTSQPAVAMLLQEIEVKAFPVLRVLELPLLYIGAKLLFLHHDPEVVMFCHGEDKSPAHRWLRAFPRAASISRYQDLETLLNIHEASSASDSIWAKRGAGLRFCCVLNQSFQYSGISFGLMSTF